MPSSNIRGHNLIVAIFIISYGFLCCHETNGQRINYTIRKYSTEHGLPSTHIKYITKDTCGFLWIATNDGLSRFDGYEFKNYFHDVMDSTSLPSYDLVKVLIDRNNHLWILGPNSICRFVRSTETFRQYSTGSDKQISSQKIEDACLDKDSGLWIVGNRGFYKYDERTDQFIHYGFMFHGSDEFPAMPSELVFDNQNNFWLLDFNQNIYFGHIVDKTAQRMLYADSVFSKPANSGLLNLDFQPELVEDVSGGIWITTSEGLFRFDKKSSGLVRATKEDLINTRAFRHVLAWSELDKGTFIYYPESDTVFEVSFPGINIGKGRYVDHDIVWFSGISGNAQGIGLIEVLFTHSGFNNILFSRDEDGRQLAIFGVIKDPNGIIWAGVRGKPYLLRIAPTTGIIRCNYSDSNNIKKGNHPRTLSLVDGTIWVGYLFNYCYWFDPEKPIPELRKVNHASILSNSLFKDQGSFRLIHQDLKGNVLIGANGPLLYYNPRDRKTRQVLPSTLSLYSCFQGRDSVIWIGATDTLYHFDKNLLWHEKIPLTRSKYNIESIVEGDSATLWLAMMGGGVARMDKAKKTFWVYGKKEGLENNYTFDILQDNQGNLWVSTNKGISLFNTRSNRFRNFGTEDGLLIEEFNADAAWQAPDREMLFGGMGGIVRFYPDSVLLSSGLQSNPPLVIIEMTAAGDTIQVVHDIYTRDMVKLPKGTKHISLSFACMDFRNAGKIQYRYRMTGVAEQWIQCDSRHRNTRFTGLKPGSYTFMLQATDRNGEWTNRKELVIHIPPYFYQTVGFKILVFILIILAMGILFWMWRRQTRFSEQRKVVQSRLDSLRNQLNPHFLFNSLNSINYFISTHDQISANQFITGFSRLMRAILTNSSAEYIPMEKELEALEDYCKLEHLRFGDKFDYTIEVDDRINPAEIEIAPTMVQPFVENAIWHGVRYLEGRKGHVNILYKPGSLNYIICTVVDDGIGRNASIERKSDEQKKRRSRGMAIIRERLDMINTLRRLSLSINVEDLHPGQQETGTRITIEIPIKNMPE